MLENSAALAPARVVWHPFSFRIRLAAGLVAVALLSIVSASASADWSTGGGEDAYITYRFAENLAQGEGFVFNPGEPAVLGTTTPLYTVILAVGARLGANIPRLSLAIGVASFAAALVLVVLLAHELGFVAAGFAVALTWGLSAVPFQSIEGMETALYLALIVGAFYAAVRRRRAVAIALAALATITRPDGLALIAAIVVLLVARRAWSWPATLPGAVILAAWIGFATATFGSPIPNSGMAKMVHDSVISGQFSFIDPGAIAFFFPIIRAFPAFAPLAEVPLGNVSLPLSPWILSVLVLAEGLGLGVAMTFRRIPFGRAILLWMLLYAIGYCLLHVPNFPWYYAPFALLGSLVFWAGVEHVCGRLAGSQLGASVMTVTIAAGLAVITLAAEQPARASESLPSPHRQAGLWLREHAQPDQTVVAYETGTIAYVSKLRTIDLLGLTEPRALPFLAHGDYAWAIRSQPDYVFTPEESSWPVIAAIYAEPEFAQHYRIVARFGSPPGADYLLYQRAAP